MTNVNLCKTCYVFYFILVLSLKIISAEASVSKIRFTLKEFPRMKQKVERMNINYLHFQQIATLLFQHLCLCVCVCHIYEDKYFSLL